MAGFLAASLPQSHILRLSFQSSRSNKGKSRTSHFPFGSRVHEEDCMLWWCNGDPEWQWQNQMRCFSFTPTFCILDNSLLELSFHVPSCSAWSRVKSSYSQACVHGLSWSCVYHVCFHHIYWNLVGRLSPSAGDVADKQTNKQKTSLFWSSCAQPEVINTGTIVACTLTWYSYFSLGF